MTALIDLPRKSEWDVFVEILLLAAEDEKSLSRAESVMLLEALQMTADDNLSEILARLLQDED